MPAQVTATMADKHALPRREEARWHLISSAQTFDRIARFDGEGLPVVSIYLGIGGGPERRAIRTKTDGLLHCVRSLADDISLDQDARMSLRADIEQIQKIARTEMRVRGTLAIFACSRADLLEV